MPILHVSAPTPTIHIMPTVMPTVLPYSTVAAKAPEAEPQPAVGQRYPISSGVVVTRSNGEEALAYVKAYDPEKALYRVELARLGSGKVKTCRDKDLRTANMVEGLLGPFRAALFASRSDDSDLNA